MGGISVLILLGILSVIFYIFIAIFFLIVIYLVITYIFESLALARMCKNSNYKHSFLAWIPFYNKYILGKIVNKKVLGMIVAIANLFIIMIAVYLYITNIFNAILSIALLVLVIVAFVLDIIISHNIFKKSTFKYHDIFTIFSALSLGFLRPIFLFILRNNI